MGDHIINIGVLMCCVETEVQAKSQVNSELVGSGGCINTTVTLIILVGGGGGGGKRGGRGEGLGGRGEGLGGRRVGVMCK